MKNITFGMMTDDKKVLVEMPLTKSQKRVKIHKTTVTDRKNSNAISSVLTIDDEGAV